MRPFRIFTAIATLTLATITFAPAATAATESAVRPVTACAGLAHGYALSGAATHVTSAAVVAATGTDPEYCGVKGYVEPAVQFELRLPTKTYAGRYLQYGCGGFCGLVNPPEFADCGLPHGGDVAVAATDDGHVGKTPAVVDDGSWGANDQAARDDFEFRAPHVVSRASKAIIQAFYGAPPKKSYFTGCSDGGREGLQLAQRYPADFDGVVAGAPANYWSPLLEFQAWLARVDTAADGSPILTAAKLPALHNAVLAACDRLDGLADGQLDDPRACHFDPAALTCAGADTPSCLTPAQVAATRRIYSPPTDGHGTLLYPGGEQPGSELSWAGWIIPTPETGGVSFARSLADNYLRYLGYPIGAPASTVGTFAFTKREFDRLTPEGVRYNAMSLDLSAFQRRGGKLVLWHGWADEAIPPAGTLDYYQRLTHGHGQDWARLFMVPSLYHCGGGTTLTEFDPLKELVAWVERGAAPTVVTATGRDATGHVTRTRPVFTYPQRAVYDGTGSIDDAANFRPAPPTAPVRDVVHWAGDGLYAIPGPIAR
ncbi:tannase/feruloyl esterase family alpha/beta hydrolase [Amycolatopsis balhimycina DSM 5908]|uniref:Tannase/feruloyl esterase family alpha/beta hydrolase n=1 Tax=Amycolatopsis balhimycina DSM 5908 TaxID=1081091 RepID=A0A428WTF9_AMYBA|nr:tannase/feruloyl esterase family alpha/beta hydrolase [Amycolatopsis balhimycina]RSM46349.1 tannase/feruloyl esterase family alpha/beta hydrolase [Amycolatopsis balhimycina DSM 5908]